MKKEMSEGNQDEEDGGNSYNFVFNFFCLFAYDVD